MSVNTNLENSILSLKTQVGTLTNGKPRYKSYSYSNVAVNATDEDMHFVASRLASLFKPGIDKITRQNVISLIEEI